MKNIDKFTIFHNCEKGQFIVLTKYLNNNKTKNAIIDILKKYEHLDIINDEEKLVITMK